MPTLNKVIRNQGTYFVVIMNNRLKIISVHGAPLESVGGFCPKKASHEGTKSFSGKKFMGRLFLIGGLMIKSSKGLGKVS